MEMEFQGRKYQVEEVTIAEMNEKINTYRLDDGTTLTLRAVVNNIYRVPGEKAPDGSPLYLVRSNNFVTVQVSAEPKGKK